MHTCPNSILYGERRITAACISLHVVYRAIYQHIGKGIQITHNWEWIAWAYLPYGKLNRCSEVKYRIAKRASWNNDGRYKLKSLSVVSVFPSIHILHGYMFHRIRPIISQMALHRNDLWKIRGIDIPYHIRIGNYALPRGQPAETIMTVCINACQVWLHRK